MVARTRPNRPRAVNVLAAGSNAMRRGPPSWVTSTRCFAAQWSPRSRARPGTLACRRFRGVEVELNPRGVEVTVYDDSGRCGDLPKDRDEVCARDALRHDVWHLDRVAVLPVDRRPVRPTPNHVDDVLPLCQVGVWDVEVAEASVDLPILSNVSPTRASNGAGLARLPPKRALQCASRRDRIDRSVTVALPAGSDIPADAAPIEIF
jgi:hypothetical protein